MTVIIGTLPSEPADGGSGGGGGGAVNAVTASGPLASSGGANPNITISGELLATNNLSDLTNAGTARTSLGLGSLATQSGTFSGISSGTNTGDQTITLTGPVTGSGVGTFGTTISASAVTLAMQANLAASSFQGNNTGAPTTPIAMTVAQAWTLLGVTPTANFPALTGDVTTTAGSLTTQLAATVGGIAGGRTLTGGTASGNGWAFSTTSNATKGQFTLSDGQFVAPVGSAAAPTYAYAGALTTGLSYDSANTRIILSLGGTASHYFDALGIIIGSSSGRITFSTAQDATITRNGSGGITYNSTNASGNQIFQTASTARYTINTNGTHLWSNIAPTVASATGAVLDALKFAASTTTISGSTAITTSTGFNVFDIEAQTYTAASAVAITNAATFTIKGAPIAGGSASITNAYSLWIQGGVTRFDGGLVFTGATVANGAQALAIGSTGPAGIGTPATAHAFFTFKDAGGVTSFMPYWQ